MTSLLLSPAAALAVAVVAVTLGLRRHGGTRAALWACGVIALARFGLLGHPLAWEYYARALTPELVGDRQYDLIGIERDRFDRDTAGPRYLAVGSSQTEAVYLNYARDRAEVDMFIVAAMMPLDFVLFSERIVARRPETVLLYLSDFDMAKRPSPEATILSPSQGLALIGAIGDLRSQAPIEGIGHAMVELGVGEILPEFKYGFIFRGLVDRQLRRVARKLGRSSPSGPRVPEEERIRDLRGILDERYVEFNSLWLERFLATMDRSGIQVVIVEGHYNPRVDNPTTARLKQEVRERIRRMADSRAGVRFVPHSELQGFGADDFSDLTHVIPEAGERFARELFAKLDASETRPETS